MQFAEPRKPSATDEPHTVIVAAPAPATSFVQMATLGLLLLNFVVMVAILLAGLTVKAEVDHFKAAATATLRHPERLAPLASRVVGATAESFLLGALNGTLANFFFDFLSQDFGSAGRSVANLAAAVERQFNATRQTTSCYQPLTCLTQGQAQCANGQVVYCYQQGQIINCANQSCIGGTVASVASQVSAVAALIGGLRPIGTGGAPAPAFASGLLNVEALLSWVAGQSDVYEWSAAGQLCLAVSNEVLAIDWSGTYIDTNGNTRSFEASGNVAQAVGYVQQVCNALAALPNGVAAAQHHARPHAHRRA